MRLLDSYGRQLPRMSIGFKRVPVSPIAHGIDVISGWAQPAPDFDDDEDVSRPPEANDA